MAASYERVGDVQGNPQGANLGDLKGALSSYEKAHELRVMLVAASPRDAWARHELADNLEQTGTMLWWNSDTPGALAKYQEALALWRALLAADPRPAAFRQGLASVLMRLADVDTWNKRNNEALGDLREALRFLQAMLDGRPQDATAQINVARCLSRIGVVYRETGDYPAALEALHRAEAIMEPSIRRAPDDRPALTQYCYELTMESEADNEQKTPQSTAGALALSPRLIGNLETLAAKDPQDVTIQHDLTIAYYDDGSALLQTEQWRKG